MSPTQVLLFALSFYLLTMLRLSLSQPEAFTVLLALESFLPEATDAEAETLSGVLGRLSSYGLSSPFKTATEARYSRF